MAATIDFLHRLNMFDQQPGTDKFPSASDTTSGMRNTAHVYLVHAAVLESALHAREPDESLLQKLVRRRLVRLERVVAALGGRVVRQTPRGLLAAFETADAAVMGACEMQRRCSVIPQISETQIALKIGIQLAAADQCTGDAIDAAEVAAIRFASLLGAGSIVVSGAIVDELSPTLRATASPLIDANPDVAARSIDWQSVPMLRLPSPAVNNMPGTRYRITAASASIVFTLGERQFSFGANHPVITIGRDSLNDIAIDDPQASRQHCKIIHQHDGYVFVDLSTNGTFMMPAGDKQLLVRKAMLNLPVNGRISLGHSLLPGDSSALVFEIKGGDS